MIERDIYGLDDEMSNMVGHRNPPPPPPEKSKDLWDFEWERKRWKEQTRWWQKTKTKMSKEEIKQLAEELELVKKKLRISEQDVFRLAAEKIDLQDTIKKLNQK